MGASRVVQHLLLAIAAFLPSSLTTPVPSHRNPFSQTSTPWATEQSEVFAVLGAAVEGDGSTHPRLEIRELEKNEDQWNIYLLGLQRFQAQPQSDKLSYYQIAGIHGRPYISWDDVGPGPPGSGGGYCPHGSNMFPPWHRPYLALFEQALYINAREAVDEFPDGELKDRYTDALSTFRMPYWDWAAVPPNDGPALPWSMQRMTVNLEMPNGTSTVPNPLHSYTFHPLDGNDLPEDPARYWPSTLRSPSSRDATASSRNDLVSQTLGSLQPNLQSRIYSIFSSKRSYLEISNSRVRGDSIESVHDTVHNAIGAGGHMSLLAYSSYDPAFWLHHTNIDRIYAMWQAINPEEYVTPYTNPFATWTYPGDSEADVDTPLHPFHRNDDGDFWTPASVRSIETFGYTYPELVDVDKDDTSKLITGVNELYGPSPEEDEDEEGGSEEDESKEGDKEQGDREGKGDEESRNEDGRDEDGQSEKGGRKDTEREERRNKKGGSKDGRNSPNTALAQRHPSTSTSSLRKRRISGAPNFSGRRKYTASIRLGTRSATGPGQGALNVYIFLGGRRGRMKGPQVGSELWVQEEGFVGVTGVLARDMNMNMGLDVKRDANSGDAGVPVVGAAAYGDVPLTAALEDAVRRGVLRSMEENDVGRYLAKELRWRVASTDGERIPVERVPGLQLSILWTEIEPAGSASEFPTTLGEEHLLIEATGGWGWGVGEGGTW